MWTVYALHGKNQGIWTKHEVSSLGDSFAIPEWGKNSATTLRYIVVDVLTRTAFAIE